MEAKSKKKGGKNNSGGEQKSKESDHTEVWDKGHQYQCPCPPSHDPQTGEGHPLRVPSSVELSEECDGDTTLCRLNYLNRFLPKIYL